MKKIITLLLVALVAVGLAGCTVKQSGQPGDIAPAPAPEKQLKTFADVMAQSDANSYGYGPDGIVAARFGEGYLIRYIATFDEEQAAKSEALDILDENYEVQFAEFLAGIEVQKVEDLSDQLPDQDKLNELYLGKTGKEIQEMGFEAFGYNLFDISQPVAFLSKGLFDYSFVFEGLEQFDETDEDIDIFEVVADLTVVSVTLDNVSGMVTDFELLQ